ncbi:MAG: hypothetical protein QXJ28_01040 [Candidatus Pacearchaeota archaeon]
MWLLLIIVVGALLALMFFVSRARHTKHKLLWILIILIFIFLYIGFVINIYGKNINYNSPEGIKTVVKLYFAWFSHLFNNAKIITTNAIKMDWKGNVSGLNNSS